jgi:hypothetical protein
MKITVTKEWSTRIMCSFQWHEKVSYTRGKEIIFFTSEEHASYKTAILLSEAVPNFFIFDFYEEVGVKCVIFKPAKDCTVAIE